MLEARVAERPTAIVAARKSGMKSSLSAARNSAR
jgi:hypothetical protein